MGKHTLGSRNQYGIFRTCYGVSVPRTYRTEDLAGWSCLTMTSFFKFIHFNLRPLGNSREQNVNKRKRNYYYFSIGQDGIQSVPIGMFYPLHLILTQRMKAAHRLTSSIPCLKPKAKPTHHQLSSVRVDHAGWLRSNVWYLCAAKVSSRAFARQRGEQSHFLPCPQPPAHLFKFQPSHWAQEKSRSVSRSSIK